MAKQPDDTKKLLERIQKNRKRYLDDEKLIKERNQEKQQQIQEDINTGEISSDLEAFMEQERLRTQQQRKRTIDSLKAAGKIYVTDGQKISKLQDPQQTDFMKMVDQQQQEIAKLRQEYDSAGGIETAMDINKVLQDPELLNQELAKLVENPVVRPIKEGLERLAQNSQYQFTVDKLREQKLMEQQQKAKELGADVKYYDEELKKIRENTEKPMYKRMAEDLLGSVQVGLSVIPKVMILNAASEPAMQLGGMVGEQVGGQTGKEVGEVLSHLGLSATLGLPVLAGSLTSMGAGHVAQKLVDGSELSDKDKQMIVEAAQHIGFLTGMMSARPLTGAAKNLFEKGYTKYYEKTRGYKPGDLFDKNRNLTPDGIKHFQERLKDPGTAEAEKNFIREMLKKQGVKDVPEAPPTPPTERGLQLTDGKKPGETKPPVEKKTTPPVVEVEPGKTPRQEQMKISRPETQLGRELQKNIPRERGVEKPKIEKKVVEEKPKEDVWANVKGLLRDLGKKVLKPKAKKIPERAKSILTKEFFQDTKQLMRDRAMKSNEVYHLARSHKGVSYENDKYVITLSGDPKIKGNWKVAVFDSEGAIGDRSFTDLREAADAFSQQIDKKDLGFEVLKTPERKLITPPPKQPGIIKSEKKGDLDFRITRDPEDNGWMILVENTKLKNDFGGNLNIATLHVPDENVKGGTFKVGDVDVNKQFRRKGIATQMYNMLEKHLGKKAIPGSNLSPEAKEFWKARQMEPKVEKKPEKIVVKKKKPQIRSAREPESMEEAVLDYVTKGGKIKPTKDIPEKSLLALGIPKKQISDKGLNPEFAMDILAPQIWEAKNKAGESGSQMERFEEIMMKYASHQDRMAALKELRTVGKVKQPEPEEDDLIKADKLKKKNRKIAKVIDQEFSSLTDKQLVNVRSSIAEKAGAGISGVDVLRYIQDKELISKMDLPPDEPIFQVKEPKEILTGDEMVDWIIDHKLRDSFGELDLNDAKEIAYAADKWRLATISLDNFNWIQKPKARQSNLPPIVVKNPDGTYEVLDGKNRIGVARYKGKKEIRVWLGEDFPEQNSMFAVKKPSDALERAKNRLAALESDVFASDLEKEAARKEIQVLEAQIAQQNLDLAAEEKAPAPKPGKKKGELTDREKQFNQLLKKGSLEELKDYKRILEVSEGEDLPKEFREKKDQMMKQVDTRINYLETDKGRGQDMFREAAGEDQLPMFSRRGIEKMDKQTRNENFKRWFADSKVVDAEGNPLVVYSGHGNTPLYVNYDPRISSAGGFYASEDPQIASNYALGKMGNFHWFEDGLQYRIKGKNGKYNKKLWQIELTEKQRAKLDELANELNEYDEHIYHLDEMMNWAMNNRDYDPLARRILARGKYDLQTIWQYNEYMGYNMAYSRQPTETEQYQFQLQTKSETEELMDALGIDWQNYYWNQPGVLPVYLRIRNPLDTSQPFPQDLLNALKQKAKYERAPKYDVSSWEKDYPLKEWINDIERGSEFWSTGIPAKALPIIKEFGYDGIKELGSKGAAPGAPRQVNWIAFEPEQIKSAIANVGTFDPFKKDMLLQAAKKDSNGNGLNTKEMQKAREFHLDNPVFDDTNFVLDSKKVYRVETLNDWRTEYGYDPLVEPGFQKIKKGDPEYEEGIEKWRTQVAGSYTPGAYRSEIRIHTEARMDTAVEEFVHHIQNTIKKTNADLQQRIEIWERAVRDAAASEGVTIPLGNELFAHAYLSYLGWENLADDFLALPQTILEQVNEYAAASKTKTDNLARLMNPMAKTRPIAFRIGREAKGYSEVIRQLLESQKVHAPPMYSKMQEVLMKKLPNKFTADMINNILQGGEIKSAEIEWSGVLEWLNEREGKIDKKELMDFLEQNQVITGTIYNRKNTFRLNKLQQEKNRIQEMITHIGVGVKGKELIDKVNKAREKRIKLDSRMDWTDKEYLDRTKEIDDEINDLTLQLQDYYNERYKEQYRRLDEITKEIDEIEQMQEAKYEEWTLPGGENYKEVLYNLPAQIESKAANNILYVNKGTFGTFYVYTKDHQKHLYEVETEEQARQMFIKDVKDGRIRLYDDYGVARLFDNPHFHAEPNVFAHTRLKDRYTADGKKILFIEEVQSDWARAGRKHGYAPHASEYYDQINKLKSEILETTNMIRDEFSRTDKLAKKVGADLGAVSYGTGDSYYDRKQNKHGDYLTIAFIPSDYMGVTVHHQTSPDGKVDYREIIESLTKIQKMQRTRKKMNDDLNALYRKLKDVVPDFPFKNNWHEFVLKNVLRMAAEEKYEGIGWTTGAQQIERYNLEKRVESIRYWKYADGTFHIYGISTEGHHFLDKRVEPERLEDYVGADLAKKIINNEFKTKNLEVADSFNPSTGKTGWLIYESVSGGEPEAVSDWFETEAAAQKEAEIMMHGGVIEGKELKLGGEWAKNLYDKTIPNFLKKYAKKWKAQPSISNLQMDFEKVYVGGARFPTTEDVITASEEGLEFYIRDEGGEFSQLLGDDLERAVEDYGTDVWILPQQFIKPGAPGQPNIPFNRINTDSELSKYKTEDDIIQAHQAGVQFYIFRNGVYDKVESQADIHNAFDGDQEIFYDQNLNEANQIHFLPVTKEMVESVLFAGQPMFAAYDPRGDQDGSRLDKYVQKILKEMPPSMDPVRSERLKELEEKKDLTDEEKVERKNLRKEKKGFAAMDPFLRRRLSTDIKRRIKLVQTGYRMGSQEQKKELAEIKGAISRYVRIFLPRGSYMKSEVTGLVSKVAKAKDVKTMSEAFDKVRQVEERIRRRSVLAAFNKLIRSASTEKGDPQFVTWIKQIRRMKPQDVEAEMERVLNETAARGLDMTEAQDEYFYLLQKYSDIANKPTDDIEKLYLELAAEMEAGRSKRKAWLADEKERRRELRENAEKVITGGKGVVEQEEVRSKGLIPEVRDAKQILSNLGTLTHSFEMIMDKLSKRDPSDPFRSWLNTTFAHGVHNARNAEGTGVRKALETVRNKLMEIYGTKRAGKIVNELQANSTRQETGAFKIKIVERDAAGLPTKTEKVPLLLSQNEAAYMLMVSEDPQLQKTFERMGWDDSTFEALKKFVKPEVARWAHWQLTEFYPEYYHGVNDVYKQIRGVDLPYNRKYMPIRRAHAANVTDAEFLGDTTEFVSIINGSLLARVSNTRPILIRDIDQVLLEHIITMEHFKGFAPILQDLRAVFNSEQIRNAIKQYHGGVMLKVINRFLNDFARGGVDRKNSIEFLDKLRSNFVRSVIGINPVVTIKQLMSFPAYAMDIPTKDFLIGLTEFTGNPIPKIRFLLKNSEMLKTRYHKGWERDVILAMQRARKTTAKELSKKFTFTDAAMMFTKFGDAGAILLGGWSVYRYHKRLALKNGLSEAEAHKKAILEFELATKRAQQAGDVEDLGELQRQGSWQKLFTMFMTAPKQYFSNASAGFRNTYYKRGKMHRNVKRLLIAHFLLPMMFQFASDGFRWNGDHMLRAALLGSLNGILILGDVMEYLLDSFLGDVRFTFDESPIGSTVNETQMALQKAKKLVDGNQIYLDEVLETTDAVADALSKPFGIPYQPARKWTKGIMDYVEDPEEQNYLRLFGYPESYFEEEPKVDPMVEEIKADEKRLKKLRSDARDSKDPEEVKEANEFEQMLKDKKKNSPAWQQYKAEQDSIRDVKTKDDPFRKPATPKSKLGKFLKKPGL